MSVVDRPKDNDGRPPGGRSPAPPLSRWRWLMLPLLLLTWWFWQKNTEGTGPPSVAYSQLFQLVEQGKVESVVFDGEGLVATLVKPEKLDGRESKTLHTTILPNDAQLLPLLRQKGVNITVKTQKQPF